MTDTGRREPSLNVAPHTAPRQVVTLAATAQDRPPQIAYCCAKGAQCRAIQGYSVITEVTLQDRAQIRTLFPNGRVHASPQLVFQSPQLGLPPLTHSLSQYREMPLPSFSATVRKAQEVERLRWAVATVSPILLRIAAKLDDSRFVGMQLEAKTRKSLAQFSQKPHCVIPDLNKAVEKEAECRPEVRRLMTHPGVGPTTALAFVLILGTPKRFQCGKQVGSYVGLFPVKHLARGAED